jgi:hypothetical protein
MKKLVLVIFIICIFAGIAQAAPFLISNVQTGATSYQIAGGPTWLPSTVATTTGAMRVDLGTIAVPGTYNITARACKTDAIWGSQCGPTAPFTLTCPAPVTFTAPVLSIVP